MFVHDINRLRANKSVLHSSTFAYIPYLLEDVIPNSRNRRGFTRDNGKIVIEIPERDSAREFATYPRLIIARNHRERFVTWRELG